MGLLDSLTDSGVPLLSVPATLFGGENAQSRQKSALRNFADNEYPVIAQQFADATTAEGIDRAQNVFHQRALRVGLRPDQMKELLKGLVEPAMRNLGAGEIGKLTGQLQGQPAQPRPLGVEGPLTPGGNFADAVPGRNPTPADMFKMAEIEARFGVKPPANFAGMVASPALIAEREASAKMHEQSQRKTAAEVAALENKAKGISQFSDVAPQGGIISPRQMAEFHPAGLPQFNPQRADPLDEARKELMRKQGNAADARAGASGREGKGSQMMQDFVKQGGDPQDVNAFLGYTEKRTAATGRGSQSVSDPSYPSLDRETDLKSIAKEAISLGKTKPEEIKAIAAKRGVILEGNPTVEGSGSKVGQFFGATEPTLTGNFEIKRKPRTTTKTPSGGARPATKGPSEDDPLNIRPKK